MTASTGAGHIWFTRAEAADYIRVTPEQIDVMARSGELRRYSVRGKASWRYKIDDLDALMTPVVPFTNEDQAETG